MTRSATRAGSSGATPVVDSHALDVAHFRIGEVAKRADVSTRTLRYYEEVGLLEPSGHSPGGDRRYSEADVERLERILNLRDAMGFDLDRIHVILTAEDRIAELRSEVQAGASAKRRREIITEAIELNRNEQEVVAEKLELLHSLADDLAAKATAYRAKAADLGVKIPAG